MVHPKVLTDPILRERYGIKPKGRSNIWLVISFATLALLWFIWSGTNFANPAIRSELISFQVIDEQKLSITYSIQVRDLTTSYSCNLVARDFDKNVVGEFVDKMPAGTLNVGPNLRIIEISTRIPAVNAGISGCQ
jgi:hypothetical protein